MISHITHNHLVLEVRNTIYKIPLEDIANNLDIKLALGVANWNDALPLVDRQLFIIRGIVALKREDFSQYRYSKLVENKKVLGIEIVADDLAIQMAFSSFKMHMDNELPDSVTAEMLTEEITRVVVEGPESFDLIAGLTGLIIGTKLKEMEDAGQV